MGWHVEFEGTSGRPYSQILKIWSDEDEHDADIGTEPVFEMMYGDALFKYWYDYADYEKHGKVWYEMDEFDEMMDNLAPQNVAQAVWYGKHIDHVYAPQSVDIWREKTFNPLHKYFVEDETTGQLTSLGTKEALMWWMSENIDQDRFIQYLIDYKL